MIHDSDIKSDFFSHSFPKFLMLLNQVSIKLHFKSDKFNKFSTINPLKNFQVYLRNMEICINTAVLSNIVFFTKFRIK